LTRGVDQGAGEEMVRDESLPVATNLIAQEARFLDCRMWDEWLSLYREDVVFWVPAWRSEDQTTEDPDRELSLIYHDSRKGLEERVARIKSGHSVVSEPLPRTVHLATGVLASETNGEISASAAWRVSVFHPRTSRASEFFGLYEFVFALSGGSWKIKRKKVTLMNDYIPTSLDIYCV
jgi:3-phenylpropionate/cinnamic acid dioxygenase small subunit